MKLPPFCLGFPLLLTAMIPQPAQAESTASKLLPADTLAFVSIADASDLAARLKETAVGQLLSDEQVRPLYEHAYSSLTPVFERIEQQAGMTVEELLAIPEGELAFAVVSLPDAPVALTVLLDTGQRQKMDQLLERGDTALREAGFAAADEEFEGVALRVFTRSEQPLSEIVQFQLEEKLVIATNLGVARQLVQRWKKTTDEPTLDTVDNFRAVMSHCRVGSSPPQLTAYVDPIALIRSLSRGNPAAAAGLAMLPTIGLDGLLAVGGSLYFAEGDFDNLMHAHILLDQPRDGALNLIALTRGSSRPETWVPGDVANYATWHWDVAQTMQTVTELFDSFRGEGAMDRVLERRFGEQWGVDFKTELLPAIEGRFSRIIWYRRPATVGSRTMLLGIRLRDGGSFRPTLEKIMEKFSESFEVSNFGGNQLYSLKRPQPTEETSDRPIAPEERRRRRTERGPNLTVALVGDTLFLANESSVVEHAILAERDSVPRLRDELDFQLMAERLKRQLSNEQPGLLSFERPSEGLRLGYELLQSEEVRQRVHEQREQNPFFRAVDEALEQQKLPPFPVIARYLSPGGSLLINEETGLHLIRFSLRRQPTAP